MAHTPGRSADHDDSRRLIRRTSRRELHHAHEARRLLAQDGWEARQRYEFPGSRRRHGEGLEVLCLTGLVVIPIDGDADSKFALLGPRAPHRRLGVALFYEIPRWEADVRVGDLDVAGAAAKLPPDGLHEGVTRSWVDAVPLGEHFEVQSLEAAAILQFRFPLFVGTLSVVRGRHVGRRRTFPGLSLADINHVPVRFACRWCECTAYRSLGPDEWKTELIVYKLETTSWT